VQLQAAAPLSQNGAVVLSWLVGNSACLSVSLFTDNLGWVDDHFQIFGIVHGIPRTVLRAKKFGVEAENLYFLFLMAVILTIAHPACTGPPRALVAWLTAGIVLCSSQIASKCWYSCFARTHCGSLQTP